MKLAIAFATGVIAMSSAADAQPRPAIELGLEHLYWKTDYKSMSSGVANRVNMHFSVFF